MSEEKPEEGKEFTPITSQDELNKVIGQRIAAVKSQFGDYDALKDKAAKFDAAEQASKTDIEKATARAEAAEAKVAAFEAKEQRAAWAAEIVKDSKVPAAVLRGSTREELLEHFEQLKAGYAVEQQQRRRATPPGKPAGGDGGSPAVAALRELRGTA